LKLLLQPLSADRLDVINHLHRITAPDGSRAPENVNRLEVGAEFRNFIIGQRSSGDSNPFKIVTKEIGKLPPALNIIELNEKPFTCLKILPRFFDGPQRINRLLDHIQRF
jgi:hypothetical protein